MVQREKELYLHDLRYINLINFPIYIRITARYIKYREKYLYSMYICYILFNETFDLQILTILWHNWHWEPKEPFWEPKEPVLFSERSQMNRFP